MNDKTSPGIKWIDAYDSPSWQIAAERVRVLKYFASSFTSCIRRLCSLKPDPSQDEQTQKSKLDYISRFLVERFLSSATIKAHFYYLGLTYHSKSFDALPFISNKDLLAFYSSQDMAVVLAISYLSHRIKKICDPKEWSIWAKMMQEATDIGGLVGMTVPGFNFSDGILIPAIRFLSLALCMQLDLKQFQMYRRAISQKKTGFSQQEELANWGCTHVQIASLLLQEMGFGISYSADFKTALTTENDKPIHQSASRIRLTACWAEAIYWGNNLPAIKGEDSYTMTEQALTQLMREGARIASAGSSHSWILKQGADVHEKVAPKLYPPQGYSSEGFIAPTMDEKSLDDQEFDLRYDQMPQEVKELFPRVEMKDCFQEVKELLKQVDKDTE